MFSTVPSATVLRRELDHNIHINIGHNFTHLRSTCQSHFWCPKLHFLANSFCPYLRLLPPKRSCKMSTDAPTSPRKIPTGQPIRFPRPEKLADPRMTMATTPPPLNHGAIVVPLGFSGQLRALQDTQKEQADRIAELECENAELKSSQPNIQDLLARLDALEQHNLRLNANRRGCVSQLLNLRPLHHDAGNAFQLRSQDIEPDDLEGMLPVFANSLTTAVNHQQRALAQLHPTGYINNPPYPPPMYQPALYTTAPLAMRPALVPSAFPMAYDEAGYCRKHRTPYWCRACGK
jgi:hypothetical protein